MWLKKTKAVFVRLLLVLHILLVTWRVTKTTDDHAGMNEAISQAEDFFEILDDDTWIVVVEESLAYIIVIGGWLLPRNGDDQWKHLDQLMEYLSKAIDTMELFALFGEDKIRGNRMLTYVILAIWSISFVQFIIPVSMHSNAERDSPEVERKEERERHSQERLGCCSCTRYRQCFHDYFPTLTGLILQDGPFLCLRLLIIFYVPIITFHLVFFVLKNLTLVMFVMYWLVKQCGFLNRTKKIDEEQTGGHYNTNGHITGWKRRKSI